MLRTKTIIIFMVFFCGPIFVSAAYSFTPEIASVTGTIQTGQTITISGYNMINEDKTAWYPLFKNSPNTSGFEGSNPISDGYYGADSTVQYVSDVKLMGNKSVRFSASGASSNCPSGNLFSSLSLNTGAISDIWLRWYSRWNLYGGSWPSSHIKHLMTCCTDNWYFQPTAGTPVQMIAGGVNYLTASIPGGSIQNNKWYLFELHIKRSSPGVLDVWIDGQKVLSSSPSASSSSAEGIDFGLVNVCGTTSGFGLYNWWDGFVASTSRVYAASAIEISNNPIYGRGTVKYQEPIYLSDTSSQIKLNLTNLGAGPYYLWVTNSKQELSAAYQLVGGGGGVEPPSSPVGLKIIN
jgi:hypothetical protein